MHLILLRCDSSLPCPRKYAKNRGRGAPGFVLKGAIRRGQGWFWAVQDPVVAVGDEPLCAGLTSQHESSVSEKFEGDITAIDNVATELAVRFEIGADLVDRDVAHQRSRRDVVGFLRASASLILNDGTQMTQCMKSGHSKIQGTGTS
jgi:hypothetical protein